MIEPEAKLAANTTLTGMKRLWHCCPEIENQRPENDPDNLRRTLVSGVLPGADGITLVARFWACNRGICKMGA